MRKNSILLLIILSIHSIGITFCQTSKTITISISDCIKGLDDFDYIRAELIEDGFVFSHKQDLPNENTENGFIEYWVNLYQQLENVNLGKPYPLFRVSIEKRPELISQTQITISLDKEYLFDYKEKLLSEIKKLFPYRTTDSVLIKDGFEGEKTVYFLIYYRKTDNIAVSYSEQSSYNFEVYRR